MRKAFILALAMLVSVVAAHADGRKTLIDSGWQFFYGDGSAAITNPEVASTWRTLDLPHDWSVETEAAQAAGGTVIGPFSSNSIGKYQTGHTVGGEGWYMRKWTIDKGHSQYSLYFEGAYNHTDVYVNGKHLYFNPYGYSSFRVDVTDALQEGENCVLVRVRNEGNNTRWYAGSGIYRHVWLIKTPQLHADEWDTFIKVKSERVKSEGMQSERVKSEKSGIDVSVETRVFNESPSATNSTVSIEIIDAEGQRVAQQKQKLKVGANSSQPASFSIKLPSAHLWSPDIPYLYKAFIRVSNGKTTDELVKHFGVRSMQFSATEGFLLNGQPTLLRGGCIHHDNGLLGAAAYDRAETRKLELLKAAGFNAVRCSHNMPSEHFLDACDSLGLMVIDEAFDQWLLKKNDDDYHQYFAECSDHDLQSMVRRDRNHPCIIMWSIGNEIPGRIEPEGVDAAERMRQTVLALDTTRPITAAICGWDVGAAWNSSAQNWDLQDSLAFLSLDLGGYNYLYNLYERDHATHPTRVMFGAESFPKQASQNWDKVESLPYVIGDFVWTAMDYLGEAGIGSAAFREQGEQSMFQDWPWYNGWCGDIDITGQKKPQSYYRDVVWRLAPITMAVERTAPQGMHQSVSGWGWQLEQQSWTYSDLTKDDRLNVNVYSRAPRVRLYLNGQLVDEKAPSATYWAGFSVGYEPGTLRAVNVDANGNEIAAESFELRTTGQPAALRLTADRSTIKADGQDLCYVTIELVDAEGQVVTSNSELQLTLSAEGNGTLLASGNASPTDMESFRSPTPRLYNGRALAILKGCGSEGSIRLSAKAAGFPDASISITTSHNAQ